MKESALVRKIILEVRRLCPRAYVRKLSDRFSRGLPDILVLAPKVQYGKRDFLFCLAVECKNPSGGVVSKLQQMEGDEINALPSSKWIVARSVEEVVGVLKEHGCC